MIDFLSATLCILRRYARTASTSWKAWEGRGDWRLILSEYFPENLQPRANRMSGLKIRGWIFSNNPGCVVTSKHILLPHPRWKFYGKMSPNFQSSKERPTKKKKRKTSMWGGVFPPQKKMGGVEPGHGLQQALVQGARRSPAPTPVPPPWPPDSPPAQAVHSRGGAQPWPRVEMKPL